MVVVGFMRGGTRSMEGERQAVNSLSLLTAGAIIPILRGDSLSNAPFACCPCATVGQQCIRAGISCIPHGFSPLPFPPPPPI
jgi:hypothetical protein